METFVEFVRSIKLVLLFLVIGSYFCFFVWGFYRTYFENSQFRWSRYYGLIELVLAVFAISGLLITILLLLFSGLKVIIAVLLALIAIVLSPLYHIFGQVAGCRLRKKDCSNQ